MGHRPCRTIQNGTVNDNEFKFSQCDETGLCDGSNKGRVSAHTKELIEWVNTL